MGTQAFKVRNGLQVNGTDVIDSSGNVTATSVTVNGTSVIDSSGNLNVASISINGSEVISSAGNLAAGVGAGISLTDISVTNGAASGGGSVSYNNSSGVITFLPPDLTSYATETYVDTAVSGLASETYVDTAVSGLASETYVDTAVSNLVDTAPDTLNTLNELAAALGDDANFATTVTTSIGTKWTQDNTKISNWDAAYGWGDHASAGYLANITGESIGDLSDVDTTSTAPTDGQALVWDNTNSIWKPGSVAAEGGGSGITYVSKTANYTASAGEGVLADTSSSAFTITLPSSPSAGDQVVIVDAEDSFSTNNITVGRNGSTISGLSEDLTLDVDGVSVDLIYNGSTWLFFTTFKAGIEFTSNNYLGIDNQTYTATEGQTTFDVSYADSNVLVYRNGIKLSTNEYTATSGTDVVLSTACAADDAVDLVGYTTQAAVEATYATTGKAIAMAIVFGG